ncbi:MAG TPA: serine/threonine-protein phosphatase, partial [Pirellulaceae bacterium]|nr:serine/threonine-protein phosphatase [Pirellulaceae bacterium]
MTDHGSYWNSFLQIATISDIGMRRTNNQDNLAVSLSNNLERWRERGHLFVVADGMGAHAAGEFASEVACDQVPQLYSKFDQVSP